MSIEPDNFRNIISTVQESGKRKWIYALQPKGDWYKYRSIVSYVLLAILFLLPIIRWQGEPLFLFDVTQGKFILFGKIFLPQDFILFGLAMLIFILFVIVFTLIFGRVFCGWVCPQTVFLEMVFRKIEYWIEGSATVQKSRDQQPHDFQWYLRKTIKHIVFFLIALLISNLFLSYIIGTDGLLKIIKEPIKDHLVGFIALIVFSLAFYTVFAHSREIVCTVVCPYGRLQSVLLDKNSIVVAYDYLRGEPRAKHSKNRDAQAGDCIDCDLCVQVCPTGIDIRNGTQMECVHCTACIDACNLMMTKVHKPINLIKYSSEDNIRSGKKLELTYRIKWYLSVLGILVLGFVFLLTSRANLDVKILRVGGQTLIEKPDGTIENLYRLKLINKSSSSQVVKFKSEKEDNVIRFVGAIQDTVKPGTMLEELFFVSRNKKDIKQRTEKIKIEAYSNDKLIYSTKIPFIGKY